jgi:mono/diheme cytochrome c family protein
MNRLRPLASASAVASLAFGLIAVVSCSQRQPETPAPPATPAMSPVQRGEYLVAITGCGDCHTPGTLYGAPDLKRALSGSELGWRGPWGVSFAGNLTPDLETGIGSWSDAEIERALRSGVKKDGSPVAPPMPWPDFARLSPEDMAAVIAYLRSIPAVKHKNLGPIPPGHVATGSIINMPPPSAWDVPKPAGAK